MDWSGFMRKSRMLHTKTELRALLEKAKVKVKELEEDTNRLETRFESVESEFNKGQQQSKVYELRWLWSWHRMSS